MTVLVDTARWEWRGHRWAHLVSDESLEELHTFARAVGLRYLSFGLDHYDIGESSVPVALELGARPVGSRELARRLVDSGLRRREGHAARRWNLAAQGSRRLDAAEVGPLVAASSVAGGDPERIVRSADAGLARVPDGEWRILTRPGEGVVLLQWPSTGPATAELEAAAAASREAAGDAIDLVVVARDERAATVELVVTSRR